MEEYSNRLRHLSQQARVLATKEQRLLVFEGALHHLVQGDLSGDP